ncbi:MULTISPECIES: hypothetical protein [unclassified Paenibacillus]|uniref:hypothetical protein n=1 Tax=unclassified Paenibacillus TaxID=185978 RepID=UPI00119ED09C|nr:hypothetical protein [Paenibacillus sp. 32O-W]
MKEAIITDLDGYMKDVTLVADHVTGVFPIMEPVPASNELEPMEFLDEAEEAKEPVNPEVVLIGYTVAVPVPPGLYKPRFDLEAWQAAVSQYEQELEERQQEVEQGNGETGIETPFSLSPIDLMQFWIEGLMPGEIEELRSQPQPHSTEEKVEQLEAAMAKLQQDFMAKDAEINEIKSRNAELLLTLATKGSL